MVAIRGAPLGMNSLAAGLGVWWKKKKLRTVKLKLPLLLEVIKKNIEMICILIKYLLIKRTALNFKSTFKITSLSWTGCLCAHLSPLGNAKSTKITEQ